MESSTVKTRILVLSDTHNAPPYPAGAKDQPYRWPLPKADVLLHAGDLTMTGTLEQNQKALELLTKVDADLKVVIPGNHDMTLHREYCKGSPISLCPNYDDETLDKIEDLYTGKEALANGIVYMVEGMRTFTLKNGARFTVYANAWQPEFYNWGFNYPREQDRFNKSAEGAAFQAPQPVPDSGIDIMITHGPPMGILDETSRGEAVGCTNLRRAVERAKPALHVFGHIHEGWGGVKKTWTAKGSDGEDPLTSVGRKAIKESTSAYCDATELKIGEETLFINASVMSLAYKPVQPPWVVDLMLPRSHD